MTQVAAAYSITSSTCVICEKNTAQYTCPRCYKHTCSLDCCIKHKDQFACNGKRPSESSMFLPASRMTDSTILSDYQFLEKVEQEKRSGERLVRDLGCPLDSTVQQNARRDKKRQKGDGFHGPQHNNNNNQSTAAEKDIIQQPLLLSSHPVNPAARKDVSSSFKPKTPQDPLNSDEIVLDDTCFIPKQPLHIPITAPSAVKLDKMDDYNESNMKNTEDTLQVLNIVPQTKTDDSIPSTAASSPALLQTKTNHTTGGRNLNLTVNKDWLARYPPHLQRLVDDAQRFCQIHLLLMPVGMQRRTLNQDTRYDFKSRGMVWGRIEYMFHSFTPSLESPPSSSSVHSSSSKVILTILEQIPDSMTMYSNVLTLLNQNLSHSGSHVMDASSRNILRSFCINASKRSDQDMVEGEGGYSFLPQKDICVFMKKIPCKASDPKFIELPFTKEATLRECLKETTIIEYPTLEIVLRKDIHHFPRFIEIFTTTDTFTQTHKTL